MPERSVLWTPWTEPGMEHLHLVQYADGLLADGMIIGLTADQQAFRLHYVIRCDQDYRTREVLVEVLGNDTLKLTADGAGHWRDAQGAALPGLDGCLDVDILATPFTNTLPIKRLRLQPGESREITAAYFTAPDLTLTSNRQRYTCLEPRLYRFEGLQNDFSATLVVDADGLVVDYPALFRRV